MLIDKSNLDGVFKTGRIKTELGIKGKNMLDFYSDAEQRRRKKKKRRLKK